MSVLRTAASSARSVSRASLLRLVCAASIPHFSLRFRTHCTLRPLAAQTVRYSLKQSPTPRTASHNTLRARVAGLPLIATMSHTTSASAATHDDQSWANGADPEQIKLMQEECILVDDNDTAVGHASKKECHLHNGVDDVPLHRAFSVFLFNTKGQLLLQQRATEKITFPDRWTNTCCSHPLYEISNERIEENAMGVKNAAVRKLEHELGIPTTQLQPSDFVWLTKIHYGAHSDSKWGEHEVDWILFVKKDIDYRSNPNEVRDAKYVTIDELQRMMQEHEQSPTQTVLTPWFYLIAKQLLMPWWRSLDSIMQQQGIGEEQKTVIHRLGKKAKMPAEEQKAFEPNGQHMTH